MNIIDKLKALNVEITPEIEAAVSGDWVTKQEMNKKLEKVTTLEEDNETLRKTQETLKMELQALKDNAPDVEGFNIKIAELTETLEKERKERAAKDEEIRLSSIVNEFFEGKTFVNDITKDAIKAKLVSALNSDFARGKSIDDLFNGIVNDSEGNLKPNILVTDNEQELAKKRSSIVGNNIHQPNGAKLSMAELMKLKNKNPDMDITPYLKK